MHDFIYDKWGDMVALLIMATGVAIILVAPTNKETGSGLIMASLGFLKLTKTYRNGNGTPVPPPEVK